MNRRNVLLLLFSVVLLGVLMTPVVCPAESRIEALVPAPGFAAGWTLDGKVQVFTSDTLYDHINGEAELFHPYGFKALASGFYRKAGDADGAGIVADIYRMGSPLDAFGIFAHYRGRDAETVSVGAEAFITESQLMFFQDRYFVRLSVSGASTPGRDMFLACAKAISAKLPARFSMPGELALISVPGIVPKSERYIAESLLGYRFFTKGLIARVVLDGSPRRVFVVFGGSAEGASAAFNAYLDYLKESGAAYSLEGGDSATALVVKDPLYGGTAIRKSGKYLIGIADLDSPSQGIPTIEMITTRLK